MYKDNSGAAGFSRARAVRSWVGLWRFENHKSCSTAFLEFLTSLTLLHTDVLTLMLVVANLANTK